MGIGIVLTILKPILNYIKNNKGSFLVILVIVICSIVIGMMALRIKQKQKLIDKQIIVIEELQITNAYYQTQILDFGKQMIELQKLTNVQAKIIRVPIYVLPKEKQEAYAEISNSFLEILPSDFNRKKNK